MRSSLYGKSDIHSGEKKNKQKRKKFFLHERK